MKARILFILLAIIFTAVKVSGQAHDNSKGGCKLAKNHVSTGYTCPACVAKEKKEKEASDAEDKRKSDAVSAKAAAERTALEVTRKKIQAERDAKNKVTEVFVTMPKTSVVAKPSSGKSVKSNNNVAVTGDIMISDGYGGFTNIGKEEIFPKNTFRRTEGAQYYDDVNRNKFPRGLGIVTLQSEVNQSKHDAYRQNSSSYYVMDLINNKGKRYFNSDTISFVGHLYGDWFLIGSDFYSTEGSSNAIKLGQAKLFNIKNKKELRLPSSLFYNAVYLKQPNHETYAQVLLDKLLYKNPDYVTGKYVPSDKQKRLHEKFLDNLSGGSEKWKAFVYAPIAPNRQQTEYKIFYLTGTDEVKEASITNQDRLEFFNRQ